jgi:hypothetical protein
MYYNANENLLLRRLPKNLIKPDGSLFINFSQSDIVTLSDYGYYTKRNDNSEPPNANSIEDESQRQIVLEKPYFDIVRTWVVKPNIVTNHNAIPNIPEGQLEDVL